VIQPRASQPASDERSVGAALSLAFGGGSLAPARARAALRALAGDIDPEQLELLELLISELVTNSFLHGGAGPADLITVQITVCTHTVHGEVSDVGPGFAPDDPPTPRDIGGLGLVIVDRVTARWGTSDGGRRVWFELNRTNDHQAAPPAKPECPDTPEHDSAPGVCASCYTVA
jgi:anti-sigma regulatory factor (Ser/Thr protein kinase)